MSDSSVPSDLMERCWNNPGDCDDQDVWDRTMFYSSDPPAITTIVVHSYPDDRNNHMETRLN